MADKTKLDYLREELTRLKKDILAMPYDQYMRRIAALESEIRKAQA